MPRGMSINSVLKDYNNLVKESGELKKENEELKKKISELTRTVENDNSDFTIVLDNVSHVLDDIINNGLGLYVND